MTARFSRPHRPRLQLPITKYASYAENRSRSNRKAPGRTPWARASILRFGPANDFRLRIRPAYARAQAARGGASRTNHSGFPIPARRWRTCKGVSVAHLFNTDAESRERLYGGRAARLASACYTACGDGIGRLCGGVEN